VVVALWLSGLAVLACLAIAVAGAIRARAKGVDRTDRAARATTLPGLPTLSNPFRPSGRRLSTKMTVTLVAVATVTGALVIAPLEGLVVGAAVAICAVRPRWRALLTVGAVALFGASALYVVQLQLRYRFPTKIEWPEHFNRVALVPWVAAAFLYADAVLDWARSRRRVPSGS
jgi:hypothetical protein